MPILTDRAKLPAWTQTSNEALSKVEVCCQKHLLCHLSGTFSAKLGHEPTKLWTSLTTETNELTLGAVRMTYCSQEGNVAAVGSHRVGHRERTVTAVRLEVARPCIVHNTSALSRPQQWHSFLCFLKFLQLSLGEGGGVILQAS